MTPNMGNTDRIIRAIAAIIAIIIAFIVGPSTWLGIVLFVIAAVLLLTAAIRFCPVYVPFKISTIKH